MYFKSFSEMPIPLSVNRSCILSRSKDIETLLCLSFENLQPFSKRLALTQSVLGWQFLCCFSISVFLTSKLSML
jgi:hypothetical protein